MENARTALRSHDRRGLLGRRTLAVLGAALLAAGCDSVVGIPGDEPAGSGDSRIAISVTDTPGPDESALAAAAVRGFAADLRGGDLDKLETTCWTMAPLNVRTMYAEPEPILAALERPGAHTGSTTVWKTNAVTVVVPDASVTGGYACPYVYTAGDEIGFNDADARHTVRRYLSRLIGEPVHPDDDEQTHPLVCAAGSGDWDPNQTGKTGKPPLAGNTAALAGIQGFVDQSIKSEWPRGAYITVSVPVTTAAGVQKKQVFTLKSGNEGYCIGDVSG
ncbi:hypothetical protein [Nocardia crassostreae]|uniref:hypothetical protein n=1 Tax=Nocardia crassostreae TaxID=53428 RepID=UPI0008371C3B|nr:hypothetical protein [Nocardia crassostreae]